MYTLKTTVFYSDSERDNYYRGRANYYRGYVERNKGRIRCLKENIQKMNDDINRSEFCIKNVEEQISSGLECHIEMSYQRDVDREKSRVADLKECIKKIERDIENLGFEIEEVEQQLESYYKYGVTVYWRP